MLRLEVAADRVGVPAHRVYEAAAQSEPRTGEATLGVEWVPGEVERALALHLADLL